MSDPPAQDPQGSEQGSMHFGVFHTNPGGTSGSSANPYDHVIQGAVVDGLTVAHVVERTPKYVVYLTSDGGVESMAVAEVLDTLAQEAVRPLYRRWELAHSLPTQQLSPEHRRAYLTMMGNGLAAIYSGDAASAGDAITRAEAYRDARTREQAKIWSLQSSMTTYLVLFLLCWMLPTDARTTQPPKGADQIAAASEAKAPAADAPPASDKNAQPANTVTTPKPESPGNRAADKTDLLATKHLREFPFVLCFQFGITGALLSVLTGLKNLPADASAGSMIYYVDGLSRIVLGGIFAIVGAMAFYANFFLGFVESSSANYLIVMCLIAVVSGASERLIPSMITSFEEKAAQGSTAAAGG